MGRRGRLGHQIFCQDCTSLQLLRKNVTVLSCRFRRKYSKMFSDLDASTSFWRFRVADVLVFHWLDNMTKNQIKQYLRQDTDLFFWVAKAIRKANIRENVWNSIKKLLKGIGTPININDSSKAIRAKTPEIEISVCPSVIILGSSNTLKYL